MMLEPVLSPQLQQAGIRHAFFTRIGGASEGLYASLNGGLGSADAPEAIAENRRRMAAHLGVAPERFLGLYQVHSALCEAVEAPWPLEARPRADAMASRIEGLALSIGTADCGPILFADPVARVIGAAHAGWKGALGGVLEATIATMEARGAHKSRIIVAIGPMLSQANYEVGPEFLARFLAEDTTNAKFFAKGARPDHPHFDLPAYIAARLAKAGIGAIDDCGLCSYADPARFFSYRRMTHLGEADYGRMIAAITL